MENRKKDYYESLWNIDLNYIKNPSKPEAYRKKEPDTEVKRFLEWLDKKGFKGKLLDIGCGAGRHSILFAKNGFEVSGFDISKNAINIAKKWAREEGLDINFTQSGILDYEDDREYDIILDYGLLHHLPKKYWNDYRKKIKKWLKPGGLMFLFVFSRRTKELGGKEINDKEEIINGEYNYFFTIKEVKELFPDFKIVFKGEKKSIDRKMSALTFYLKYESSQ